MSALEKAARACAGVLGQSWEDTIQEERDLAHGFARAVLMAVREPGEEIGRFGFGVTAYVDSKSFTAMIDAILSEGEPK